MDSFAVMTDELANRYIILRIVLESRQPKRSAKGTLDVFKVKNKLLLMRNILIKKFLRPPFFVHRESRFRF
jgi:hypothetical protein